MWTTQPHPTPQIHFALKLALPLTTKKKKMHKYIYTHFLSCMVIIVGYHYLSSCSSACKTVTHINRQNVQTTSKFVKVVMCKFMISSVQMLKNAVKVERANWKCTVLSKTEYGLF